MKISRNTTCAIQLFGGLQAQVGSETLTHFATRKTAALLALLALAPNQTLSREILAERLWPDEDPDITRKRLRQTLAVLRHALEPSGVPAQSLLKADRVTVQLDPQAAQTDVAEFERILLEAAKATASQEKIRLLQQAVTLYHGELLAGFYDAWILPERERLAEAHLNALLHLVALLESGGVLEQAVGFARQAVAADPLNEETHCYLIRLYARLGRLADALRQYRELERRLQEQLGAVPSPAAQRLREQALRNEFSPAVLSMTPPAPSEHLDLEAREPPRLYPAASLAPLPASFTHFLGREKEIEQITALLGLSAETPGKRESRKPRQDRADSHYSIPGPDPKSKINNPPARLITLTGAGGCGKTRLALKVAERMTALYGDRVWFIPLANLTGASRMAGTILETLHLPRLPRLSPLEQLTEVMQQQPVLLLLDNLEQLLEPLSAEPAISLRAGDESLPDSAERETGADVVQSLLARVPGLVCLITSRQRLGIVGEREFVVHPLPIPAGSVPPERLLEFTGIQLFVDRAQAAHSSFQLTEENARAVAALCQRLEGIPLAIELAAGWAALLTPEQMLAHFARLDHLASRQKDALPRHRTYMLSAEWSFRLLDPPLQRLFARLSVFRGGWTLDAAESITKSPQLENLSSRELLALLRDRSLIVVEEAGSEMRYRMLETLREFAAEQLTAGERSILSQRHAAFFLRQAEAAELYLKGAQAQIWLERLERERYNLMAALDWYLAQASDSSASVETERDHAEQGLRLVGALWLFWDARGHLREGCDYALALLGKTGSVSPPIRAKSLCAAAKMAESLSDLATAQRLMEEALIITRTLGDRKWEADILNGLGVVARDRNDTARAQDLLNQSLALREEQGDARGMAVTLADLGNIARDRNDFDYAVACYTQSLAICRRLADRRGSAYGLKALGVLAQERGDLATARRCFQESLKLYRKCHHRWGIAYGLNSLGRLTCQEGDFPKAHALLAEGLAIRRAMADRWSLTQSLESFTTLHIHRRDYSRAARLMGAAERLHQEIQSLPSPNERAEQERDAQEARAALGEADFAVAWEEGSTLSMEEALLVALETGGL